MGRIYEKFKLLMWKNFKLQIRHPVHLFLQIFIPVFFCAQILLFRGLVQPVDHPDGIHYKPFNITFNKSVTRSKGITWSPCNLELKHIMNVVVKNLNLRENCVDSSKALENSLKADMKRTFCGVVFDDNLLGNKSLHKNMHITIRFPGELKTAKRISFADNWHTYFLFPPYSAPGPRDPENNNGASPKYNGEGFLALQKELLTALMLHFMERDKSEYFLKNFSMPNILMQRFSYPPWVEDLLLLPLREVSGFMLICSFLVSANYTIKTLTNEKETQIKEAMKIMGLPNWLHWTAWFIKSFVILFISSLLVVCLFKVRFPNPAYGVLTNSDSTVLILLMVLYICSSIMLCFAVSVFFNQANTATAVGALIWFLLHFPYGVTKLHYDTLTHIEKLAICLGSNSALPLAIKIIFDFESQGEGIQWNNIWMSTSSDDTLTVGHVMIMLILDAIIYLFIALYVETIYPGEFGVPKPWYFPLQKSFWIGYSTKINFEDEKEEIQLNQQIFEEEPINLIVGVKIRNLKKIYSNKKIAVKDLCLNMFEGQITALLGHNGAGKSTTISILTGLFPPSSGTAIINGYDITTNMNNIRDFIGLCPQYNIIFNELTVEEHFYFFGKLKGLPESEVQKETEKYITLLELEPKKSTKAEKLSGGMKRKLCIGIALCGKSKVVLLDEPTAGVDPAARRAVWNILQKEKKGRTILLTTHFMDEADLLGDRIAIMADGKLQCCGSSFFLKKTFGTGYHLILEKDFSCQPDNVTSVLRKYIPDIQVENNVGSELSYLLNAENSSKFQAMLQELEEKSTDLGICSYGISLTTLEEVFMKLGADSGQEEFLNVLESKKRNNNPNGNIKLLEETKCINEQTLTGFRLIINQTFAMFLKRSLSTWRSWILLLIQILIPVVFIILGVLTVRKTKFGRDMPKLNIDLNLYDHPVTLVNGTNEYKNEYLKIVGKYSSIKYYEDEDLSSKVTRLAKNMIAVFRRRYIIGATFDKSHIIGWFNNEPFHSPPLALHYILNAIMKRHLGDDYNIELTNYPLPYNLETKLKFLKGVSSAGLQLATNIGLSMAFVSSMYILFYVKERVTGAKHLQYVSGANVIVLWAVSFLWDLLTFTITSFWLLTTLLCFQEEGYDAAEDIARLFFILLLFAFSVLPMTYLASFIFQIPSSGYTYLSVFNVFTGTITFMIVKVLNSPVLNLKHIGRALHWVFLIFPHYTLSSAIQNVYLVQTEYQLCQNIVESCTSSKHSIPELCEAIICSVYPKCCNLKKDFFAWEEPGIGKNIFYSILTGSVFILILLLMEYGILKSLVYAITSILLKLKPLPDNPLEDSDVLTERNKIRQIPKIEREDYSLLLCDITKYYRNLLAVNKLCLGVKKCECFGLLGINGAGKTSTFKMITGDTKITSGEVFVNGLNIKNNLKQVYKVIGYCPQFDALLDNLTPRETLIFFALLRGMTYNHGKLIAQNFARDFDYSRHLDKKVKQCSGGTKRKISTSLALVGNPEVIYLDEPTTGMDPATKRHVWNIINKIRDNGKCVILTSHSMEECEALCTKLAIMVNGTFKCLGSVQHLKNKFSQGYTLTIKLKKADNLPENLCVVQTFITSNFSSAKLVENYKELVTYHIPDSSIPWSKMFSVLEEGKSQLQIEDYSLGQCSLEQVFVKLCQQNDTCYVFDK